MDALLPTFIAAALAEFGDRTQLLAMLLGAHFRRSGPVLAGIALAAVANALIAATGGELVGHIVNFRAISLLVALSLIAAGAGALWRQPKVELANYGKVGIFGAAALGFFILEFGDKTQFITFAMAARSDSIALAAAGASAGVILAAAPAVLLGERFRAIVPLKPIRIGIGILFLTIGLVAAIGALRLF